jgi:putative ABC transport system ATP-binding protein
MMAGTADGRELVRLEKVNMIFPPTLSGASPISVLHGTDLAVNCGELVLVEGCSGAGKTTLLGVAGLLWRPTSGRVIFLQQEVGSESSSWRNRLRRQHLGFVFQNFQLFERMPAWESVALGLRIRGVSGVRCRQLAGEVMERLGLRGRENHRSEQLSGGEQQRVAVARAVCADPDLVIADEPLSNADPRSAELILRLLNDSRECGAGLLVASHDPRFRTMADRVLELSVPDRTDAGDPR